MSLLDRKLLRDISAHARAGHHDCAGGRGAASRSSSRRYRPTTRCSPARDRFYADARFPQVFVSLKRAPLSIVAAAQRNPRHRRGRAAHRARRHRRLAVVHAAGVGPDGLARPRRRRTAGAPAPAPRHGAAARRRARRRDQRGLCRGQRRATRGPTCASYSTAGVQSFHITGIALSPEYVYAVKPGLPIPDDRFFAVLWIDRTAAEAAFDMKGAFNDAVVSLAPGRRSEAGDRRARPPA